MDFNRNYSGLRTKVVSREAAKTQRKSKAENVIAYPKDFNLIFWFTLRLGVFA